MKSVEYKEFKELYGVSLLPYSTADTQLTEILHTKGLFSKTLIFDNATVLDFINLNSTKLATITDELKSVKKVQAEFPNIIINNDFNADESIKIPVINLDIGNNFEAKHLINFTLTGVQSKRLFGTLEDEIKSLVNPSELDWKKLKHKLLITQLFYADSVVLKSSHNLNIDFEGLLSSKGSKNINVSSKENNDGSSSYTFSGNNMSPFAAQLVKIKDWINN